MNKEWKRYGFFNRIFFPRRFYENLKQDLLKRHSFENIELKNKVEKMEQQLNEALKLSGKSEAFQETNILLQKSLESLQAINKEKIEKIVKLEALNNQLLESQKERENKLNQLTINNNELEAKNDSNMTLIGKLDQSMQNLQSKIAEDQKKTMEDTSVLLNIFKKTTGTAGKIAELRLEDLITKTSIDPNAWTKNLSVGQDNVEFAIKADDDTGKWIPVDSKLIGHTTEGKVIVDEKYSKKVFQQAKEVAKYLNKKNTTTYGIMVLQSDSIYNEIYEHYPEILMNSINDLYVFIMSPSAFVQFSTAINKLTRTFEKAKRASSISNELNKVIGHINKLLNAWDKAFTSLSAIDSTHIRNIKTSTQRVEVLNQIEYSNDELPNINFETTEKKHIIEQQA